MASRKTIFQMEVNNKEYSIHYSGNITGDSKGINFLYGIVMAVVRCKRREAKKESIKNSK